MARMWARMGDAMARAMALDATMEEAHTLLLEYKKMRDVCFARERCIGCDYYAGDTSSISGEGMRELSGCMRMSTDDVLDICGAVIERERGGR